MAGRNGQQCDRSGCREPGAYLHADGGPGRWCALHGGHLDDTPAHAPAEDLSRAGATSTWRLRWQARRLVRGGPLPAVVTARWAAVRDGLRRGGAARR